nr:hypothetical protein [Candidatus Sigynarchaeota archaeon]
MSTSHPKVMLDPSIFLHGALEAKNVEDEKNVTLVCNSNLFERLEDLARNYEVFTSQSFMNMYLKVADELKALKGSTAFFAPVYILMRLFGLELFHKKDEVDDNINRYVNIFNTKNPSIQAFLDIADKIRALFKNKKIKQYAFRANIGRGYVSTGPTILKKIDSMYKLVAQVQGVKESINCTPDLLKMIYEDMLDFVVFDGPIIADRKQSFILLEGAGLPTSTEKKPNPDLIDRDRSFLIDKFKGVRSRSFRFLMSKLKSDKIILLDMKDFG